MENEVITGNTANRTLAIARQRVFGIGPGRWDNGPINLKKNTETANWYLRQGDEEVNKKNICLNKMRNIPVWKQTFFRG